ncbi:MAG: thioredoxin domain-containing protein [Chloroflexota bacterium]|nr:thioredoxin domain-containing protein [Chloroflexota bacterium]
METEQITYKAGLTYICAQSCGTQITVDAFADGGPITCCGQPVRRGRVLAIAPRQVGTVTPHELTPYRLYASEGDFDDVVNQPDRLVMVEFTAPWCGACKAMDPLLDEVAAQYAGQLQLVELDVDASPAIPERFKIRSVPCLLFMSRGRVVGELFGQVRKGKLTEEVQRLLAETG